MLSLWPTIEKLILPVDAPVSNAENSVFACQENLRLKDSFTFNNCDCESHCNIAITKWSSKLFLELRLRHRNMNSPIEMLWTHFSDIAFAVAVAVYERALTTHGVISKSGAIWLSWKDAFPDSNGNWKIYTGRFFQDCCRRSYRFYSVYLCCCIFKSAVGINNVNLTYSCQIVSVLLDVNRYILCFPVINYQTREKTSLW